MSVTSVEKNVENLTLTLISDFEATVERVWQLWADPRQLERWWGPPTYPATMEMHELNPGGSVTYFMTGPEGDRHRGWWTITTVDPPHSLAFIDGFADDNGDPAETMPTTNIEMKLFDHAGGTRMEMVTQFASREQLDQLIEMGMQEGLTLSVGQMDELLKAS